MTITKERLAEIKARAEAATPAPWRVIPHSQSGAFALVMNGDAEGPFGKPDFKFIAHARTDIPDLVAEVERLQGLLKRIEWADEVCGEVVCPFCGADKYRYDGEKGRHFHDCPAFTPEGEVR